MLTQNKISHYILLEIKFEKMMNMNIKIFMDMSTWTCGSV